MSITAGGNSDEGLPGAGAGGDSRPVLVVGATGYVGGRLVPLLVRRGHRVRAVGRSPEKLAARPWADDPRVETVACDAGDPEALGAVASGCRAVFYLVHSMTAPGVDFAARDRAAARAMVAAADRAGVERIIYLGGLGDPSQALSPHLKSRNETGEILRTARAAVTELRAAMIIGSGSASFEILRYLTERLPVMVTPRWVRTLNQPIAIRDVLSYLVGVLELPRPAPGCFDIGGPEVLTYADLVRLYAEEAGLPPRLIVPVPVLTPTLSSYWIHFVTPVPAYLSRPLVEGLRNPVLCADDAITRLVPIDRTSPREAIRRALDKTRSATRETHWSDAGGARPETIRAPEGADSGDPEWAGGPLYRDERTCGVSAPPEAAWDAIRRIGGETGWYHADGLWRLRGLMDRLVGGVGLRRGRRDPVAIRAGDALDFWRVLDVEPGRSLVLLAEMKLPGEATLEFHVEPDGDAPDDTASCRIRQVARFRPRGLLGHLYWFAVLPLHGYVFAGMLSALAAAARLRAAKMTPPQCLDRRVPRA